VHSRFDIQIVFIVDVGFVASVEDEKGHCVRANSVGPLFGSSLTAGNNITVTDLRVYRCLLFIYKLFTYFCVLTF